MKSINKFKIVSYNERSVVRYKPFFNKSKKTQEIDITQIPKKFNEKWILAILAPSSVFGSDEMAFGIDTRYYSVRWISQTAKVLTLSLEDSKVIHSEEMDHVIREQAVQQIKQYQGAIDRYTYALQYKRPEITKPPPRLRFSPKSIDESIKRVNLMREEAFIKKLRKEKILK